MPQFAGQMLPTGDPNAVGPLWIPANGAVFNRLYGGGTGGNYFKRVGWLSGAIGIYRFAVPNTPGYVVLIDDNPSGTTLPGNTPTAAAPPVAALPVLTIAAISNKSAGAVPVSGTVTPTGAVNAAPLVAGIEGTPVAMTVAGTAWSGNVTMATGTAVQIRARLASPSAVSATSNTFNVT